MTTKKLLVYGTLKGTKRQGTTYLHEGIINGAMYNLGAYPGVKTDEEGLVHGEVYEVEEFAWSNLDAYEGCPNLYKRIEVETVETVDGIPVYVYHYNHPVSPDRLIETGVWNGLH